MGMVNIVLKTKFKDKSCLKTSIIKKLLNIYKNKS